MKKILLPLLIVFGVLKISAQNAIGIPDIVNYNKATYTAGAQNWAIGQDLNGLMYFANNEGVLCFDGSYWRQFPLPNKTIVRSIAVDGNRIYAGGQNEMGYFSPNSNGNLTYTSLLNLLPDKQRSFSDVWNIVIYNKDVFFRTTNKIFQISGSKLTEFENRDWRYLGVCGKDLVAQNADNQLIKLNHGAWEPFSNIAALPKDYLVTGILRAGIDSFFILTLKSGIFLYSNNTLSAMKTPDIDLISQKNIYTGQSIDKETMILGTSLGGCYILTTKGTIKQSFSGLEGIQNNNVRSVFLDRDRNVWLGLDNGIDFIAFDNAIKHIYTDDRNEGSGYASSIFKDNLYLGTSNGLYTVRINKDKDFSLVRNNFEQVANSKGQVWNLSQVNGNLFMGHHEGSFIINGNTANSFDHSTGFWGFLSLETASSSFAMAAGTYNGLNFYALKEGKLNNQGSTLPFESARILAIDKDIIWVAHPYKGIYKIKTYPDKAPLIESFSNKHGFVSTKSQNAIYKIKNKIIATSAEHIYEYDPITDSFHLSSQLEALIGKYTVSYLKDDLYGNTWFVSNKNVGVIDYSTGKPVIIYIPELNGKVVSGFENINPVNLDNVLIGAEKGFYHINYNEYRKHKYKLSVLIRTVKAENTKDSLVFGGFIKDTAIAYTTSAGINYRWNSFHFEYSCTLYGQQDNIEYSYYLTGFDNKWSEWSKKTEKDYTNLPGGRYTFKVKARNNLGNESEAAEYTFTILPPWYQSLWAKMFYLVLFIWFIYWIYKRQKRIFIEQQIKHEEEQKRLQYLHHLEINKSDKEIVKLQNEKLEVEINHKNKELATATMHLVQKGELMSRIREELMRLLKDVGNEASLQNFRKVIKMMTEDDKFDQDWEQFSFHFDSVHGGFLLNLKNKFPKLSSSELKLCAYLRLNLSTKEMAQLMNISVRGVEISRYRLRKKLNIPTEITLYDFLTEAVKTN